jgi:tetratricopeptide (TPR) repeat protein
VIVGYVLMKKSECRDAIPFLEAGLSEYPQGPYNYFAAYELAVAQEALGDRRAAIADCRRALELKADFEDAATLMKKLEGE